jgi:hypothetical protein
MPTGANIDINKIQKKQLSFFIEKGGGRATSGGASTSDYDTRICGEDINIGGVYIDDNKKIYNSGVQRVDLIAIETGNEGDRIRVTTTKPVTIPDAEFTIGAIVWLINDVPNLTTVLPTPVDDMIIQKIGTASAIDELYPLIGEANLVVI